MSHKLIDDVRVISKVENRSLTGQIEYWAKIMKIAEENPTMSSRHYVKNLLMYNTPFLPFIKVVTKKKEAMMSPLNRTINFSGYTFYIGSDVHRRK